MKIFQAELHVHTVLSPCAGIEMIPPLIVSNALKNGINLIAITDHNQSANAEAVMQASVGTDLIVLPGMELQTREEVHCLCLFDTLDQLFALQSIVDEYLPDTPNNVEFFGEQFIVDKDGEFIKREDRLLINSTDLTINHAENIVTQLDGIIIPAHVNREAYGLLSHLGFVPPELKLTTLEISRHITEEECKQKFPQIKDYHLIQSGDVHFIDDFLGANYFELEQPSIKEIALAFSEIDSRLHIIKNPYSDKSHSKI